MTENEKQPDRYCILCGHHYTAEEAKMLFRPEALKRFPIYLSQTPQDIAIAKWMKEHPEKVKPGGYIRVDKEGFPAE